MEWAKVRVPKDFEIPKDILYIKTEVPTELIVPSNSYELLHKILGNDISTIEFTSTMKADSKVFTVTFVSKIIRGLFESLGFTKISFFANYRSSGVNTNVAKTLFIYSDCPTSKQISQVTYSRVIKICKDSENPYDINLTRELRLYRKDVDPKFISVSIPSLGDLTPALVHSKTNSIFLSFSVKPRDSENKNEFNKFLTCVFGEVAKIITRNKLPQSISKERRDVAILSCKDVFIDKWKESREAKLDELRATIESSERELNKLAQEMGTFEIARQDASRSLYLETSDPVNSHLATKEFDKILQSLPDIVNITVDGSNILFHTRPLNLENNSKKAADAPSFKPFLMHPYTFTINTDNASVSISCAEEHMLEGNSLFCHPHIRSGQMCLGNITRIVPRLAGQREYYELICVLLHYVKSFNPRDEWGSTWKKWQKRAEERDVTASKLKFVGETLPNWYSVISNMIAVEETAMVPGMTVAGSCSQFCQLKSMCLGYSPDGFVGKLMGISSNYASIEWEDKDDSRKYSCTIIPLDRVTSNPAQTISKETQEMLSLTPGFVF